jgi:hypothetical protein
MKVIFYTYRHKISMRLEAYMFLYLLMENLSHQDQATPHMALPQLQKRVADTAVFDARAACENAPAKESELVDCVKR